MRYDPQTVAVAFERLFRTYRFVEPSEADEMLRVYFEALADYETRDIEAGIRDMLSGRVDGFNPSFLPPAPLVAKAVREAMLKRLDSEARNRKALPPPVEEWPEPTAEQRARVKALMDQVRRDYGSERSDKEREEATRAMLRRTNEHFDSLGVTSFNSADDDQYDMGGERAAS